LRNNPFRISSRWFQGTYQSGMEVSSFRPQGCDERWWVGFEKVDAPAISHLVDRARGQPLAVEFHGRTSDRGKWGHMGLYEREFVVDEVRDAIRADAEEGR
jgi:hypothetical protein